MLVCYSRLEFVIASACWWGGRLVYGSVGKANLLSDHFDSKQSRESVDLPLTGNSSANLSPGSLLICHSLAIRLKILSCLQGEISHLSLDLDNHGGTGTLRMFPHSLKRTADILAPHLSVVFRQHVINSERSPILICCKLLSNFRNISDVRCLTI